MEPGINPGQRSDSVNSLNCAIWTMEERHFPYLLGFHDDQLIPGKENS